MPAVLIFQVVSAAAVIEIRGAEERVAARTRAACIDLNPVRSGVAKDLVECRWSS